MPIERRALIHAFSYLPLSLATSRTVTSALRAVELERFCIVGFRYHLGFKIGTTCASEHHLG